MIIARIDPEEMAQLKQGLRQKVSAQLLAQEHLLKFIWVKSSDSYLKSLNSTRLFKEGSILELWTMFETNHSIHLFPGGGNCRGEERRLPAETGGEEEAGWLDGRRLDDSDNGLGLPLGIHRIRDQPAHPLTPLPLPAADAGERWRRRRIGRRRRRWRSWRWRRVCLSFLDRETYRVLDCMSIVHSAIVCIF